MARTDTLSNYLTDVASAIKTKKGDSTPILASSFDTEITNLPSGTVTLQNKTVPITSNGTTTVTYDRGIGYDGLDTVTINTNVTGAIALTGKEKFTNSEWSTLPTWLKNATGWSNYTSFYSMFSNNDYLTTFDSSEIVNLDISNVTTLYQMFSGDDLLETITFGNNFDTSNVTTIERMFMSCIKVKNLNLSNFDTTKLKKMGYAFYSCTDLETITFGNDFDTSLVTDFASIFGDCEHLQTINFGTGFTFSAVTTNSGLRNLFNYSKGTLDDATLNEVLRLCTTVSSRYPSSSKKLTQLGFNVNYYPASRFTGLSNYTAFTNAGWSIGY